jgi:glycosyltransferase involved in cell wall biosynthesis
MTRAIARYAPWMVTVRRGVTKWIKRRYRTYRGYSEIQQIFGFNGHPTAPALQFAAARDSAFLDSTRSAENYAAYRSANIEICAEVFDHVLAVSERTRHVLVARGVPSDNIRVSYIGTAHKEVFDRSVKICDMGQSLHIAYLGYMRRRKGFHLFLQALELLPDPVARAITLTVAAKRAEDPEAYSRLRKISARFASFHDYDGFTHETLDAVLEGVNLGIVPPIWEDNLPQVAIEMVSRGIPILTSDRGGAQEIAGKPDFVFAGGAPVELKKRIEQFSTGAIPLSRFWEGKIKIYSMAEHVGDLLKYYRTESAVEHENASRRSSVPSNPGKRLS